MDICYVFVGTIPSSVCKLTKLAHLGLAANFFSGELPTFIGCLGSLKVFDIYKCNFVGPVPSSFHNLTHLVYLDLSYNDFLGQNTYSFSWIANNSKLTYLRLSYVNLTGEIPSWLMNLTQLTDLSMDRNHLTGQIPSWIFNMNHLSNLYFSLNRLTGQIPSQISNLTQLKFLRLASNKFQGPIPSSLFELKNLEWLTLSANNFSGTLEVDMFLHKFKRLEVLGLSSNKLSLLANSNLNTSLKKLWFVGLGSCNLTVFPNFLQNLDQLIELDLSSNKIASQVPRWLLHTSTNTLKILNLSNNFVTGFGQHPVVLPWTNLLSLDLRSNKLQAPFPIPPMSTIHFLVSNNHVAGGIPSWICNLKYLDILDLSNNELSGTLPQCFGNLSYLSVLQLQSNKIHGGIPETFINGTNLRMMDLSNNMLQGRIPRSLATYRMLEFLNLGNNQISDIFPAWLGSLPELQVLILRSNKLHGVIGEPESDFRFPKLRIIDLSYNSLVGELPSQYFQCWNAMKIVGANELTYLHYALMPTEYYYFRKNDTSYGYSLTLNIKGVNLKYEKISNIFTGILLSNNKFTGEIPASIANLKVLQALNVSNNELEGYIPSSLSNITALESLDLSSNRLSGEIPQQLVELTFLEVLDVSHNNLVGHIPLGNQFNTFDNNSFDGNPGLCGKPLSRKCENSEAPPQEEDRGSESPFAFSWKIVLIGYASGLIVGVVLGQEFYIKKHEWFTKKFGRNFNRIKRQRGRRN